MICYKDITYCPFWLECVHGGKCRVALTEKILNDAEAWWGHPGVPIAQFATRPECWKGKPLGMEIIQQEMIDQLNKEIKPDKIRRKKHE